MKKVYKKPIIIVEDFSLKVSIAAGCEVETPLPSYEASCGYPTREGTVFIEGTQCTTTPPTGSKYDSVCYHVPAEDNNLFNS